MIRTSVLVAGAVVVIASAFVAGSSVPPHESKHAAREAVAGSIPPAGQKIGFFNMPKVLGEYKHSQISIQRVKNQRDQLLRNLVGMKHMYQQIIAAPRSPDVAQQERVASEARMLARKIEDMNFESNRLLNSESSRVVVGLYDDIRAASIELCQARGLGALLAYPDSLTVQECDNPVLIEAKLKPLACYPFYLDPALDYTSDLIDRLNAKFEDDGM